MKKIAKPILELSNICRSDKNGSIERLDLSLTEKDCFAVVHDREKSISLLMEIISGKSPPKKGKIFFKGDDVTNTKNNFGIVRAAPSMPKLKTVAAYAAAPIVKRGLSRNMTDVLVRKEINAFGLSELADQKCAAISKSDAVKAAVFAAYMCSHELIVMEDPFSLFSGGEREELIAWFKDIREKTSFSLLIFTKDIDLAVDLADFVMVSDKNTASKGIIAVDKRKKERAREQIAELAQTVTKRRLNGE